MTYVPRDISPDRQAFLTKHAEATHQQRQFPRGATFYDLGGCEHNASQFVTVENPHGAWEVELCNNCGRQIRRTCEHRHNTWDSDGKVLTCDNCGIDGT